MSTHPCRRTPLACPLASRSRTALCVTRAYDPVAAYSLPSRLSRSLPPSSSRCTTTGRMYRCAPALAPQLAPPQAYSRVDDAPLASRMTPRTTRARATHTRTHTQHARPLPPLRSAARCSPPLACCRVVVASRSLWPRSSPPPTCSTSLSTLVSTCMLCTCTISFLDGRPPRSGGRLSACAVAHSARPGCR